MLAVTTMSYKFFINGATTKFLEAKRGLRQGDHLSPLLFVIVMEYLHMSLQRLKDIPDFNYHAKYENLHIVNVRFVDDLLLFYRGDTTYVKLLMKVFSAFSKSTGL